MSKSHQREIAPSLDHRHPLATFEEVDLGDGKREPAANSWGTASVVTFELADQGPSGPAADYIAAMLAQAGHPEAHTRELIRQVLAATDDSQAHLRTLQQQFAEAFHQEYEKAFGQEGNR